jgi:hypothetical protein
MNGRMCVRRDVPVPVHTFFVFNRALAQELGIKGSVVIVVNVLTPAHLVATSPADALLSAQKARLPA